MAKNSRIQLIVSAKDKASKVFRTIRGRIKSLASSVFSLKAGIVGLGTALGGSVLAKSFINAARETENYQVRLKVLLGSQKEGNRLFKEMSEYAGRVPFEYNEIMASATQLAGIMKGGVDEITQWMPLIGDLAAASGLGIQQTTEQVSRMLSAGAASADLFRERGILSMLGFQAGVTYSAEETRKQLWSEWNKAGSQFKGATGEMANTWDGLTSMLKDAWFQFRQSVMGSGVFDGMKNAIKGVIDKINELKKSGRFDELAKGFGDKIMTGLIAIFQALPGIVSGAIKAAEMLILALSGFKQIRELFDILLKNAQIWGLELVNNLRLAFIHLLEGIGSIPGVNTDASVKATYADIGDTINRIEGGNGLRKELEAAELALGRLQIKQDDTEKKFKSMAETAADEIKEFLQPAVDGLIKSQTEGGEKAAEAEKKKAAAADLATAAYNRQFEAARRLNAELLKGKGGGSFNSVDALADALDDEADR